MYEQLRSNIMTHRCDFLLLASSRPVLSAIFISVSRYIAPHYVVRRLFMRLISCQNSQNGGILGDEQFVFLH